MNLLKIFPWKFASAVQANDAPAKPEKLESTGAEASGNLIYLDNPATHSQSTLNLDSNLDITSEQPPDSVRFKGLMNVPELTSFFAENFFGYGRHAGALFRTQEALELGRKEFIARFINTLDEVAERKHAKANRLKSEMIAIEGLSASTSRQLQLACEQLDREIELLKQQSEKALDGKGWILEALNRYQIGFHKGMREAIEFEILAS